MITGLLAATYSGLFLYDGWLYSESLYIFCFTGFVYTLVGLQHSYQGGAIVEEKNYSLRRRLSMMLNRWSVSSVLFMALAILTRPNGSVLLGMLCIWAVFLCGGRVIHRKGWQQLWQQVLLMCCLAIVLVLPWNYRNYQVSHQPVFVSTGLGEVLAGVYNDKVLQQPPANRGFWIPADGTKIHDMERRPSR